MSQDERAEVIRLPDTEVIAEDASRTPAPHIKGTICDIGLTEGIHSGNWDLSSIEA
jgi:hypothetical protein